MIDHTQVTHVRVINTHASAGFDRRLDDFPQLVHNVTTSVENITARIVCIILPDDKRLARLIIGSRAFRISKCLHITMFAPATL